VQSFTRRPLMTSLLFGADGLRGPGLQASVLLPLPWFATLYAESFALGPPDLSGVATFGGGARASPANLAYTTSLQQDLDATESTSLLLGASFASGRSVDCPVVAPCDPAANAGPRSYLYGGYLYAKWKPVNEAHTYLSLQWTTEFWARTLGDGGPTEGAGY